MAVTSLTSLAAGAQNNIRTSSSKLQSTIAHLASGKRINQAYEDIASMSVAAGLSAEIAGLRSASNNIAQASSMLQVADGGLNQIGQMLDRMQAISVQANSGALDANSRKGLNTEFQALADEIDRISGNTNFNKVNLLDGSLSTKGVLSTSTTTAAQASGSVSFTSNMSAGQTIVLNGVTLTAGADFTVGGTIQQTVDNIANAANSSTNPSLSQASFSRSGNSLQITAKAGGEAGNQFTINQTASTGAANFFVSGDNLLGTGVFSLTGGTDSGLNANSVQGSGTVNDNLVTSQSQNSASASFQFNQASDIAAGNTLQVDDGQGGFTTFTFVAGAPVAPTDIQIGSTLGETLQNAAATMNNFSGAGDFGTRQLNFTVNGNNLDVTKIGSGNALDTVGAALNLNETTGGTLTSATLNNGTNSGIDASGVTNEAFTGTIQGFQASFTSANNVQLSVTVGSETYTANVTNTDAAANTTVRFQSENGGFFDVQLAGGNGQAVNNQSDANTFANRVNAAFSGVSFSQNREVSSFNGQGSIVGSSLSITGQDFSDLKVDSIKVTGGTNAKVEFTINGETYTTNNLGSSIGASQQVTLTSTTHPSNKLTFTNGQNNIDLSTQAGADSFKTALDKSVGLDTSGGGVSFQIGSSTSDLVKLSIGDVSTNSLFGGKSLNLLSADAASTAIDALRNAMNTVTSTRADVGAYQQDLGFADANLQSAIQNQLAARSVLEDTDFGSESTAFAQASVQNQSSIAMLAQTNRLQSSMLKLLVGQ